MAEDDIVTLDRHGRMVIPKPVRERFKTEKFELGIKGGKIVLKPVKGLDQLFGSLPELDLKRIRKEHEEEAKDEHFGG